MVVFLIILNMICFFHQETILWWNVVLQIKICTPQYHKPMVNFWQKQLTSFVYFHRLMIRLLYSLTCKRDECFLFTFMQTRQEPKTVNFLITNSANQSIKSGKKINWYLDVFFLNKNNQPIWCGHFISLNNFKWELTFLCHALLLMELWKCFIMEQCGWIINLVSLLFFSTN